MNMPKSRDMQAKMPSPKVIFNAFWLVTVKVLNSYQKSKKAAVLSVFLRTTTFRFLFIHFYIDIHPNALATELARMIRAKIGHRYLIITTKIFFLRNALSP